MKDLGFFIGFFAIIIFFALFMRGDSGIFNSRPTPLSSHTNTETTRTNNPTAPVETPVYRTPQEVPPPLSPDAFEREVARLYRELDTLKADLREAKLREPTSPYTSLVTLSQSTAGDTDPDREYLTLRADSKNTVPLDISDWYLKSYVTGKQVDLPHGDRILEKWRSPGHERILLYPGEIAYLSTGDSPIDTSFRENICTGYLTSNTEFYPSLSRDCPLPLEELERSGTIALDDDRCYDYVKRLGRCTHPDDVEPTERLSNACTRFIDDTLNHNDCVRIHRGDPFFAERGAWRIYLKKSKEQWRREREIIRLHDEEGRIVSVIEY